MADTRPMAVVTAPGIISLQEVVLPSLGPTEVRIEVKAVTLCGSDLHIFKGKHPSVALPIPVGHEIAGEIAAIGQNVTHVKVGDRVAVEPVIVCDHCIYCRRGEYHLCSNISFQYRQWQGGLTPSFIADQRWVHKLPERISFQEGALLEPLAVAVHAVRKAQIPLGGSVAIFGDGAIGLLLLKMVRESGAGAVYLTGIRTGRLKTALELGATRVFNNLIEDPVKSILEKTQGLGVSRTFEAVGIQPTLLQSMQAVEKGGTVVMVGLFETAESSLPTNLIVQREITLTGSQGYSWDFQRALALVEHGALQLDKLVTHTFPLEQVQDAFELLMEPESPALKVAIVFD